MIIKTHLILISAQAVPNITPVLDETFKPRQVIMLVSPDMHQRADWLEQVINKRGVKTSRWLIADAWDIEHIRDRVLTLIGAHPDGSLALNATGGTKPMSIAAYEVFRDLRQPVFYVHPEQDRIIWLYPATRPSQALADRIKLPEFFQAYGATVSGQGDKLGVQANYRELTETIIRRISYYAAGLGSLNYLAQQAYGQLSCQLNRQQLNDPALLDLIALFAGNNLITQEKNRLVFADESARFYVNGGWFEQHVYGLCLNIKKQTGIQDIARSIQVDRLHQNKPVRNEIDVTFLKDNRLYVIECKTKRYSGHDAVHSDGANTLYKLDTLKDLLGGLQAKAMLVSFIQPNEHVVQRAGDLKIALCYHKQLPQLTEKLLAWIK
jgi:hypothetical protein